LISLSSGFAEYFKSCDFCSKTPVMGIDEIHSAIRDVFENDRVLKTQANYVCKSRKCIISTHHYFKEKEVI